MLVPGIEALIRDEVRRRLEGALGLEGGARREPVKKASAPKKRPARHAKAQPLVGRSAIGHGKAGKYKRTREERLKLIKEVVGGTPAGVVERREGLGHSSIRAWAKSMKIKLPAGRGRQPGSVRRTYTDEYKHKVVAEVKARGEGAAAAISRRDGTPATSIANWLAGRSISSTGARPESAET